MSMQTSSHIQGGRRRASSGSVAADGPAASAAGQWSRRAVESVRRITELAANHLSASRCGVWSLSEDGTQALCVDQFVRDSARHIRDPARKTADAPALYRVTDTGLVVFPESAQIGVAVSQRHRGDRLLPPGVSAVLAAPLWSAGRLSAMLCVEQTGDVRRWTEEDMRFVQSTAAMVHDVMGTRALAQPHRIDRSFVDGLPVVAYRCGLSDRGWILSDVSEGTGQVLGLPAIQFVGARLDVLRRALSDDWPDQRIAAVAPTDLPKDLPFFDYRYKRTSHDGVVHHFVEKGSVSVDPVTQQPVIDGVVVELSSPPERPPDVDTHVKLAAGALLSQVSHELRTPLNAILGFAQLLELDPINHSSQRHEYLVQIQRAGHYLLDLISETMDLSRIEAGALELESRSYSLASLIDECLPMVVPLAERAGVEIVCTPSARSDVPHVLVDSRRLSQVLMNLLSNAIKYNRQGGRVALECRDEGPWIRLLITDTGIGMTERQMFDLFKPFNRLGMERSDIEGVGLGLVITRRLVEAMGGQISATSEAGVGTTFELTLLNAAQAPVEKPRVTRDGGT